MQKQTNGKSTGKRWPAALAITGALLLGGGAGAYAQATIQPAPLASQQWSQLHHIVADSGGTPTPYLEGGSPPTH